MTLLFRSVAIAALGSVLVLSEARDAHACGGCFHPMAETGSSVITDHRMVFKISKEETILWDQVQYSGNPREFAWVLPVRAGARVELSRDAWIAALDASTRTTVTGPERNCFGAGGGGGGSGGGCGFSSTSAVTSSDNDNFGGGSSGGFQGDGNVEVVSQSVIGPYQAVTIRATGTEGIDDWLIANGFAIPEAVRPTIDAYTRERFDFIALRLRPDQSVRAMRPVRVVAQGADLTLPLRMVAAGIGARVGLTLWVIGEGRYRTQNFPEAVVDYSQLKWDGRGARSNYATLMSDAFAATGGRGWLTEASFPITKGSTPSPLSPAAQSNPKLEAAYRGTCVSLPPRQVRCTEDELPPADGSPDDGPPTDLDAGAADATADASTDGGDAGDAGTPPKPTCTKTLRGCDGYDDFEVATRGLAFGSTWVTRLRANLPVSALSEDLRLEAAPSQVEQNPQLHTEEFTDPSFDPCEGRGGSRPPSSDDGCGCRTTAARHVSAWLALALTALTVTLVRRRRWRS